MARPTTEDKLVLAWCDEHPEVVDMTCNFQDWLRKTTELESLSCALSWYASMVLMTVDALYVEGHLDAARLYARDAGLIVERMSELL